MSRFFVILVLIKGLLLATVIDKVEVDGVEIPLILEQDSKFPIVDMQIVFLTSGAVSDGAKIGIANLSAAILGEGTLEKKAVGFARELENRAIELNTNAGRETFVFELSSLKEQFSDGVDLLNELISSPNITKESLAKTKQILVGQLSQKESNFDFVANRGLRAMMYQGTALEHQISGSVADIEKLGLDDIERFLDESFVKSRAVVLFGGDVSLQEAQEWSKKILKNLKTGKQNELKRVDPISKSETKIVKKPTEQAYIYFGSPFFMEASSDEAFKASVASFIFGGSGFGSRLMEEIRVKRGYAYSAYSSINLAKTSSRFKGYLQTKLENQDEAIKAVKELLAEFVKNGATKKELEEAKKFLLGSEPLRNETMSQRLSRAFNDFYRGKELGWSKTQLAKIESLTIDELNSFIKSHDEVLSLSFFIVTK